MKIVKLQHSIYENITSPDYWAKFNCKSYQGFEWMIYNLPANCWGSREIFRDWLAGKNG